MLTLSHRSLPVLFFSLPLSIPAQKNAFSQRDVVNLTNINQDELAELNAIAKADMMKRRRSTKVVRGRGKGGEREREREREKEI